MNEQNIEIETLPALKEGERRIFHIEVGNLPAEKAMEYVEKVRDEFAKRTNDEAYFAPMRNGQKSVIVETIKEDN
jgi:hypothetical protein